MSGLTPSAGGRLVLPELSCSPESFLSVSDGMRWQKHDLPIAAVAAYLVERDGGTVLETKTVSSNGVDLSELGPALLAGYLVDVAPRQAPFYREGKHDARRVNSHLLMAKIAAEETGVTTIAALALHSDGGNKSMTALHVPKFRFRGEELPLAFTAGALALPNRQFVSRILGEHRRAFLEG